MRTPLHTRIYASMAVALVAGVMAWGGPLAETGVDAQEPAAQPTAQPTAQPSKAPVPVPLQATVQRPTDPQPVVADPDHVGRCPKHHSPVIWQGLSDGRPTWRHQDGSITQRAQQRVTTEDGEVLYVPVILSMRPAEATSR